PHRDGVPHRGRSGTSLATHRARSVAQRRGAHHERVHARACRVLARPGPMEDADGTGARGALAAYRAGQSAISARCRASGIGVSLKSHALAFLPLSLLVACQIGPATESETDTTPSSSGSVGAGPTPSGRQMIDAQKLCTRLISECGEGL